MVQHQMQTALSHESSLCPAYCEHIRLHDNPCMSGIRDITTLTSHYYNPSFCQSKAQGILHQTTGNICAFGKIR